MYFPNLDELSFLVVFALPIDSMIGLLAKTRFSMFDEVDPAIEAKYRMANFAETVFPAPDSPDTMID